MKVWKYELNTFGMVELSMPAGAQPLHVDVQAGQPCLWALVDPEATEETRRFVLAGTGHDLGDDALQHVGTYLMLDGIFVYHLFEVTA